MTARTYNSIHSVLKRRYGGATTLTCEVPDCDRPGAAWAYRGGAGADERVEVRKGTPLRFAVRDLDRHYSVRCSRHHAREDAFARAGRCVRDEAETFLLDLIDRHGQLLLSRRVLAAAAEAGIPEWALRNARELLGLKTKRFYSNGTGRGSVIVWLVPAEVLPDPGQRKAGTSR